MNKTYSLLLMLLLVSFGAISQTNEVKVTIENYENWGWDCIVIENGLLELVIVPEIGGRIMKFNFPGDEHMAINEANIGVYYDPTKSTNGPWGNGWGYGGYKNWPAPQSYWNWPPPPILDWAPYSYTIEHQSADSVIVYLESEVEKKLAPGLKQSRRIKVYKQSTLVTIEQYLTNVSATVKEYSIWDITQTIVQHGTENDATNFSVYFSSKSTDIRLNETSSSKKLNITEIETDVHKFQDTKSGNKAFINVLDGWCAHVDERDEQSYFKLFDIDAEASYPDKNANFEIYTAGDRKYIEIEVLGPLQNLPVGSTIRFDEDWSAAHLSGPIIFANRAGAVKTQLNYNQSTSTLTGNFGIFHTGKLLAKGYDTSNSEVASIELGNFEAGSLVAINQIISSKTYASIKIEAFNSYNQSMGIIDEWLNTEVNVHNLSSHLFVKVFPTLTKSGQQITIDLGGKDYDSVQVGLFNSAGERISINQVFCNASGSAIFELPAIHRGIYFLKIATEKESAIQKIIIH